MTQRFLGNWTVCPLSRRQATETMLWAILEPVECGQPWLVLAPRQLAIGYHSIISFHFLVPRHFNRPSTRLLVHIQSKTFHYYVSNWTWAHGGGLSIGNRFVLLIFALGKSSNHIPDGCIEFKSTTTIIMSLLTLLLGFLALSHVTITLVMILLVTVPTKKFYCVILLFSISRRRSYIRISLIWNASALRNSLEPIPLWPLPRKRRPGRVVLFSNADKTTQQSNFEWSSKDSAVIYSSSPSSIGGSITALCDIFLHLLAGAFHPVERRVHSCFTESIRRILPLMQELLYLTWVPDVPYDTCILHLAQRL